RAGRRSVCARGGSGRPGRAAAAARAGADTRNRVGQPVPPGRRRTAAQEGSHRLTRERSGAPRGEAPRLLMTPGPTRVPERVLRAGARPMIHHRTPEFSNELAALLELIAPVFGARPPVLPLHTTCRCAMDAAICMLCSAGDEIAACCNGRFGELWARIGESYGLVVHRLPPPWERGDSC